jgi:hypothetical protein
VKLSLNELALIQAIREDERKRAAKELLSINEEWVHSR